MNATDNGLASRFRGSLRRWWIPLVVLLLGNAVTAYLGQLRINRGQAVPGMTLDSTQDEWVFATKDYDDWSKYLHVAQNMVAGRGVVNRIEGTEPLQYQPFVSWAPGTSCVLAVWLLITGGTTMWTIFWFVVLAEFLFGVIALATAQLYTQRTSSLAICAFFAGFCPALADVFFSVRMTSSEITSLVPIGLAMYALSKAFLLKENPAASVKQIALWFLAAGVWLGLASLIRDFLGTFGTFVALFLVVQMAVANWRKLGVALLFAAAVVVPIESIRLPVKIWNQHRVGQFVVSSWARDLIMRHELWDAHDQDKNYFKEIFGVGFGAYLNPTVAAQVQKEFDDNQPWASVHSAYEFVRLVLRYPRRAFMYKLSRIPVMWFNTMQLPYTQFTFVSFWCLGMYGMFFWYLVWRWRSGQHIPETMYLYPLYLFLASFIIHSEFRYSFPCWHTWVIIPGLLWPKILATWQEYAAALTSMRDDALAGDGLPAGLMTLASASAQAGNGGVSGAGTGSIVMGGRMAQSPTADPNIQPIKFGAWVWARTKELPDLFWIAGIGIAQIFLVSLFVGRDEQGEWIHYLSMASIFPLAVLVVALLPRFWPRFEPAMGWVRFGLTMLGFGLTMYCLQRGLGHAPILAALVQLVVIMVYDRHRLGMAKTVQNMSWWWTQFISLMILIPAWGCAIRLTWWEPFKFWLRDSGQTFLLFPLALGLAAIAICQWTADKPAAPPHAGPRWRKWLTLPNLLALVVLGLASMRSDSIYSDPTAYHHCSVIVGPAEMVRQGGWLLWDVPSQYGFLNTLILAYLPFETVWQSLYALHGLLLLVASSLLYLFLRQAVPGRFNFPLALLVSLFSVHILCWAQLCLGPQNFPSVGPFRFFWIYALSAVLLWELNLAFDRDRRWTPVWVGMICWILGTLWSAESSIYCAAMWIPAYSGMLYRRLFQIESSRSLRARLGRYAAGLGAAPLALLTCVAGITVYYLAFLGHAPDWQCMFDHSMAFKNGFGCILIDPHGAVATLLLVFFGLTAVFVGMLRSGVNLGAAGVLAGVMGGAWAASSYFIPRSHDNNICNLTPILCSGIAVVLCVVRRQQLSHSARRLLQVGFVPVLTMILIMPFGRHSKFDLAVNSCLHGYNTHLLDSVPVDPKVVEAENVIQVRPDEAEICLSTFDEMTGSLLPPAVKSDPSKPTARSMRTAWLPMYPWTLLEPLPEERRAEYVRRFCSRRPLDGWILLPKELADSQFAWLFKALDPTHELAIDRQTESWRMLYFTPHANLAKATAGTRGVEHMAAVRDDTLQR
ncbi:MAG TPA: hypothetical protein VFE24_06710 [Pirellulales bacterium]|jgi:hypothetical protein|nr:hypothetical protein [Pirellulales bacterium]